MPATSIRIRVDPETARTYRAASDEERRKLDLLLSLRLREVTQRTESLEDVVREVNRNAMTRGLTEEELERLLRDE
jgi:hypothetical protein